MTPLRCAKTAGPRTGVLTIFDVQLDVICGGVAALLVLVVSFRCRYKELRLPTAWMVVSNRFFCFDVMHVPPTPFGLSVEQQPPSP